MVKKVILGTLLVGLIGVLVAGAMIRTVDKTGQVAEAAGLEGGRGYGQTAEHGAGEEHDCDSQAQGHGQGHGEAEAAAHGAGEEHDCDSEGEGHGQGHGEADQAGQGRGGASAGEAERQYPNHEAPLGEQLLYKGTVQQAPAAGVDLVIVTDDGEEIKVGTGPGYMETQGFLLQAGEAVMVQGFWEDDELKATQVTREDGQTISLRDESGHPAWAGSGRRAAEQQAAMAGQGQGQDQGGQGQGGKGAAEQQAATVGQGQGQGGRGQGGQGKGQGGYGGGELQTSPRGGALTESEIEALTMALQDEYKAWSVYEQVIAKFGDVRPFTSIQKAEENHIAALLRLFNAYGLEAPMNEWLPDSDNLLPTFDSVADACAVGVQAEVDNAGLYVELFDKVNRDEHPDIIQVFTALRQASLTQHLPAFERCATP